jgi:hypothetical protein
MDCGKSTTTIESNQSALQCTVCDQPFIRVQARGRPVTRCESHRVKAKRPRQIRLRLKNCLRCWKSMKPGTVGRPKKWCSAECRRNRSAERERLSRRSLGMEKRDCRICLKPLNPNGEWLHGHKLYCSRECGHLARCVQSLCVICQEPFFHLPNAGTTCSYKCRGMFNWQKKALELEAYTCKTCDQTFIAPKQANRTFCGQVCHDAYYKKRRSLLLNATRRLTQMGHHTSVEAIVPIEVFKRDNWTCWICTQPIDRGQQWPQPLSPTIDHVIPITKGGEHTMANVRCAHAVCNNKKKNNIYSVCSAQSA